VCIAPRVLAHDRCVALEVEQIVGDLESEPDVAREPRQGLEHGLPGAAGDRAAADRRHEQRPRLAGMDRLEVFEVQFLRHGPEVGRLAGAACLDGEGELGEEARAPGRGGFRRAGQNLERPGDEADRDELGGRGTVLST
jgi:hypothetical protein